MHLSSLSLSQDVLSLSVLVLVIGCLPLRSPLVSMHTQLELPCACQPQMHARPASTADLSPCPVAVQESHSIPGGAAHSFERQGFHFDSGPSLFSGLSSRGLQANPLAQVLEALDERVECIKYDSWMCYLPEGEFLTRIGPDDFFQVRGASARRGHAWNGNPFFVLPAPSSPLPSSPHHCAFQARAWPKLQACSASRRTGHQLSFLSDATRTCSGECSGWPRSELPGTNSCARYCP